MKLYIGVGWAISLHVFKLRHTILLKSVFLPAFNSNLTDDFVTKGKSFDVTFVHKAFVIVVRNYSLRILCEIKNAFR